MAESHGNSPAAWTGVAIILVASALICLGIMFDKSLLWGGGILGIVLGVAAWVGLQKAGHGEHSPRADRPAHETATSEDERDHHHRADDATGTQVRR
ncbi:HGxxPAAW family protein [Mobilicoccus pelagius]|uniref:Uncharacterized protein n=1 Tax=Mobilicoccus pelagius NBRC 104925 TaxID=1089455 RepID=H5UQ69_9MICO|nr:HGxxPAAW family protein [Mobilicoccus pelagius]GAB47874.1 hypothetical protein MOPEL_029_01570 [Mobilicoccus pelagius NBRC 104925]